MRARVWRMLCGLGLVACGLPADCAAGWLVLSGTATPGLLLHVPATAIWVCGAVMLAGGDTREAGRQVAIIVSQRATSWQARRDAGARLLRRHGWAVVALTLCLLLFPGFGPLGGSVVLVGSGVLGRRPPRPRDADAWRPARAIIPARAAPILPLRDLAVQPAVDLLRSAAPEHKRRAIALLSSANQDTVRLLRGLLSDPDREVRSAAAVMLFRIEEDADRSLRDGAQGVAARADHLYRYAMSGLPDDVLRRFYLRQAEAALRQETRERATAEQWITLARVQRDLRAFETALEALDQALALEPMHIEAHALSLEIAFELRQWERVQAHALLMRDLAIDDADLAQLIDWWTDTPPPRQGTPYDR